MSTDGECISEQTKTVEQRLNNLENRVVELEAENAALRDRVNKFESVFEIRGDADNADLSDFWVANIPVGLMVENQKENRKAILKYLFGCVPDLETIEEETTDKSLLDRILQSNSTNKDVGTLDREKLRPAHRMWHDYSTGDPTALQVSQRRAAVLFGEFVTRVVDGEANNVDASGQNFTMNTEQAKETLEEAGELDVSEESKATVVPRAMREVSSFTKDHMGDDDGECGCKSVDKCKHTLLDFRAGKPHSLAVPKKKFKGVMQYAYRTETEDRPDQAETQEDDAGSEQERKEVAETMDELAEAMTAADD